MAIAHLRASRSPASQRSDLTCQGERKRAPARASIPAPRRAWQRDLPALCVHLKYFPRLRKRFRSSNLLERSLEEVQRTKVIGRFPGETSRLRLCWAVLDIFIA